MAEELQVIAQGQGTDTSSANNIQMELNTVYEHRINTLMFPGVVDFFNSGQIESELAQNNCMLISKSIEGNDIVYRFQIVPTAAAMPYFALPLLGLVLAAIMFAIAALIIGWTVSKVILPASMDVLKISLILLGVVGVIAAGYILLKKSGAIKPVGEAIKKTGEYASSVKRRIVEEY